MSSNASRVPVFPSVGLSVTQPPAFKVFQRKTTSGGANGTGVGTITLSANLTYPAAYLEYRLRDATSTAVVQDWYPAGYNLPAGAQVISCYDAPAYLGWYLIDIRANADNSEIVLGTNKVGVGRVLAVGGQSEAVRMFGRMDSQTATIASLGISISPYCSVYGSYTDTQRTVSTAAWAPPADGTNYDSSGCAELLRLQVQDSGVTCALIGYGDGGTAIATWLPGQSNYITLAANIAAAGGAYEVVFWFQGASDAAAGTSTATYTANLTTLFSALSAANSGPTFVKILSNEQCVNTLSFGTFAQVLAIRAAHINWCAANGATWVPMTDVDLVSTNAEISMSGYILMARHWHRATRPSLGLPGVGDAGPTMGTPSVSGAVITIPITQAGGTALVGVGNWWQRFGVFAAGTTTSPYTINSGTLSSSAITLTLSSAPSGNVDTYFDIIPSGQTGNSGLMVYDNNTSDSDSLPLGRPLMPQAAPLTIPALTVNTPSNVVVGYPVFLSGSYRGTGYTPTGISYQENGTGSFTALSNFSASNGTWSGTGPTYGSTASNQTITVEDSSTTSINATSGTFSVAAAPAAQTAITLTSPSWDASTEKFGSASLSGSSSYGTLPYSACPPATGSFTVECWAKTSSVGAVTTAVFGMSNYIWLGITPTGVFAGGAGSSATFTNGTTNLADGNWHHYAACYNQSTLTATAYVDGVLAGTKTFTAGTPGTLFGVKIFEPTGTTTIFPGEIDELAMFTGIRYTGTFTPPSAPYIGNETNMTGVWHLDGDGTGVV